MIFRIIACLCTAIGMLAGANDASAGVWRWGCQGTLGTEQIIFIRDSLLVAPANPPRGKIEDLIFKDTLAVSADDINNSYDADIEDLGFTPMMKFAKREKSNTEVVFMEKSSKRISHTHELVCGRDENTTVYRKTYRYQREDQPARNITMQCYEYQLSTRHGRKGCD